MSQRRRIISAILMVAALFMVSLALVLSEGIGASTATAESFWTTLLSVFGLLLVAGLLAGSALMREVRRILSVQQRRLDRLHQQGDETQKLVSEIGPVMRSVRRATSKHDVTPVVGRLEAAERRLLASLDSTRLSHGDQFAAFESRLASIDSTLAESVGTGANELRDSQDAVRRHIEDSSTSVLRQVKAVQVEMRRHARDSSREVVREVEALLQLMSRVDTSERRFPSSGGFAMDAEGLLVLTDLLVSHRPQRILEIGSGVSTTWMGEFVHRHGGTVVSLEHQEEYAEKSRQMIALRGLQDVAEVRLAALVPVHAGDREFQWYDPQAVQDLEDIDLLVVDGPPQATGKEARYPALPLLIERLAQDCLVVIDDFGRPDERHIVDQWLQEFPDFELVDVGTDRVGLLRRG